MSLADPVSLTVVTGLLMIVGLVGIVVPVVPGLLLTVGATLLWAYAHPAPGAWVVFWVAVVLYAVGVVTQYLLPGRTMRREGVGTSTMLLAVALGIVGFFVIPVIGLPLGFVLGVFLAELAICRDAGRAWTSTVHALKGVALLVGVEFTGALLAAITWAVAVVAF